jgi:dGTPase
MDAPRECAPFASRPSQSRGRRHTESESSSRTVFQRDRDRVVHSTAFRRLKHKTQVFVYHEGDHYRTRLTHSIEVAQIARAISRTLGLDEDLTEALALAHDLGHTPFGHAGEEALAAAMADFGGFDHNAQSLRVLTKLEHRYADFDGLNLTWETLEGVVKHNGPLTGEALPTAIAEYVAEHDLELHTWPGAEAQVAAIADDIAYNNHDIDDGLRAGLFDIGDLEALPLVGAVFAEVAARYPGLERGRTIHESVRRLIDRMVGDVIAETGRRIAETRPAGAQAVRDLGRALVGFSDGMNASDSALKTFLHANMYNHYTLNRSHAKARRVVRELFEFFIDDPACMPPQWQAAAEVGGVARACADYIAGMTDRYALQERQRLFGIDSHI